MRLRRQQRGWQTHRVYRRPSSDGIVAAAQNVVSWDLGRPNHERGAGLSITDAIEIAELAVAGWLTWHAECREFGCDGN